MKKNKNDWQNISHEENLKKNTKVISNFTLESKIENSKFNSKLLITEKGKELAKKKMKWIVKQRNVINEND